MFQSSHTAGAAPRHKRTRHIVDGFQVQYLLTQLAWVAVSMAVFVVAVLAPLAVPLLRSGAAATSLSAATALLIMNERLWLPLLGFFLVIALVAIRESHRVAGPLYRFRHVFKTVADGDLSLRVTIRENDYLIKEAAELDRMVAALRQRVVSVEAAVAQVQVALRTTKARLAATGSSEDLEAIQAAVLEAQTTVAAFNTTAPARKPAAVPVTAVRTPAEAGFSLIELMIALAILTSVAAIGLPALTTALTTARVAGAIGDINAIGKDAKMYEVSHGCLPASLAAIGHSATTDPWGRRYRYSVASRPGPPGGRGKGAAAGGGSCSACGGACVSIAQARKDKNLVPINRDFDLYSFGKDGKSASPLTAGPSKDDIIWGRDGGFIGLASEY